MVHGVHSDTHDGICHPECCSFSSLVGATTLVFLGFIAMIGCGAAGLKGQLNISKYWSARMVSIGAGFTALYFIGCCSFCAKLGK